VSRIGKKILEVPNGVEVSLESGQFVVSGPKGKLLFSVDSGIELKRDANTLSLINAEGSTDLNAKHGMYRAILANMVKGVSVGFERELELVGVGYRVQLRDKDLVFSLGFSHPVEVSPPEGISFSVEGQNKLKVTGIDCQLVGQVAANIRELRPPEAYKAKGIRYAGEVVKKKPGKSVKK